MPPGEVQVAVTPFARGGRGLELLGCLPMGSGPQCLYLLLGRMNQGRDRTSTRRPELRLLFVGVALVLRNEWEWLRFAVLSTPRPGGRLLRLERLRLRSMPDWLLQVIEKALGTIEGTKTESQLCSELRCLQTRSTVLGTTELGFCWTWSRHEGEIGRPALH